MIPIQPLAFRPGYFEKIWGGHKIRTLFDPDAPAGRSIGESWLVADHPNHESIVAEGPLAGTSLRQLLSQDASAILGRRPQLTVHGRFPLLLKIIDAAEALSVQVHPDDAAALRLGEPDVGKTEMWHVMQSDVGAELICGLKPGLSREAFAQAVAEGGIERQMECFPAPPGTTVFVPAGTVHAIGAGLVLAEIQQNSDVTYRIYDWGRVDKSGKGRPLHLDQAAQVSHFGVAHGGPAEALAYRAGDTQVQVLGACRYFAGERLLVSRSYRRDNRGATFHILMGLEGTCRVRAADGAASLKPGYALLIPGAVETFTVDGPATILDFYVPDLARDIVAPLQEAGHAIASILRLGGMAGFGDLPAGLSST